MIHARGVVALLLCIDLASGCSSDESGSRPTSTGGSAGFSGTGGAGGNGGQWDGGAGSAGASGAAGTAGGAGSAGASGSAGTAGGAGASGGAGAAGGAGSAGAAGAAGAGGDACCGIIGPTVATFAPSGPIVLTTGQTITGLHITSDSGPCIQGSNVSNVHIHDNRIGPCGDGNQGNGVAVENVSGLTVDNNHFEDVASALYAVGTGNGDSNIVFERNLAIKVRGPMPRGQMVQFNHIDGPGHRIECNVSDQAIGGYGEGPEDHVNMFASNGTEASPIMIRHNRLRGGGSKSGGGIVGGDAGGSYVTVQSNILVDAGQYGIAVASGHHIRLLSNTIYAQQNAWTNVGCFIWLQYDGIACYGNEIRGNRVNYTNKNGEQNPFWNAGNCGEVEGLADNSFPDSSVTAAIWDGPFDDCP